MEHAPKGYRSGRGMRNVLYSFGVDNHVVKVKSSLKFLDYTSAVPLPCLGHC